jgi:hypothetical protein
MLEKPLFLRFQSKALTTRTRYNTGPQHYSEGSALNANYQDVEAACIISNALGEAGYRYGIDFTFDTCGLDQVHIQFYNNEAAAFAAMKIPMEKYNEVV